MAKNKRSNSSEDMSIENISSSNNQPSVRGGRRSAGRNKPVTISYKEDSGSDEDDKESDANSDISSNDYEKDSIGSVEVVETSSKESAKPNPTPKKRKGKKDSDEERSVYSIDDDEYSSQKSNGLSKSTPTPSKKRKVTNVKNKKSVVKIERAEKAKIISLPDNYPVSSILPQCTSNDVGTIKEDTESPEIDVTTLKPGSVLIECSGNDIVLKKGVASSMNPNLDKMKGKYLIILPGMLTLNSESKDDVTNNSITPQSTMQLGRLEKLHTDEPTLSIPLPNDNKLVFQGRKINSTSKFLSLKCTPGTNRSAVDCNGIFSSVIVFSDAAITYSIKPETEIPELSQHYGGSSRTVDGGKKRKKSSKTAKANPSPKAKKSVEDQIELSSDDEESEEEIELSSGGDDEEFNMQVETTPSSRKSTPKRSSSYKKPVNYKDFEDSADENDSVISVSDSSQAKSTPKNQKDSKSKETKVNSKTKDNECDNSKLSGTDTNPEENDKNPKRGRKTPTGNKVTTPKSIKKQDDTKDNVDSESETTEPKESSQKQKAKGKSKTNDNESDDNSQSSINTENNKPKRGRKKSILNSNKSETNSAKSKSKRMVSLESKSTPTKGRKTNVCSISSSDEENQNTTPSTPKSRFRKGRNAGAKGKKNLDTLLDDSEFDFIDLS